MFFRHRDRQRLARVEQLLEQLLKKERRTMSALDDLKAQVTANTNIEGSAIALIQGMAQKLAAVEAQLQAQGSDVTALNALRLELHDSASALAGAITANTIAPEPVAPPAPATPPAAPSTP